MQLGISRRVTLLIQPEVRAELARKLKELGFKYVTLDLEGFRSGSLNDLVSLDMKKLFAQSTSTT